MFASLWRRDISAVSSSWHRAARMPRTLLADIDMPIPLPHSRMPRSHSRVTTARQVG